MRTRAVRKCPRQPLDAPWRQRYNGFYTSEPVETDRDDHHLKHWQPRMGNLGGGLGETRAAASFLPRFVGEAPLKENREPKKSFEKPKLRQFGIPSVGQATKGLRWMPWDQGPMKGVVRLRKASMSRLTGIVGDARMGKPGPALSRIIRLWRKVSGGTETSQYPEENKSTEIPLVVANERGTA